MERDGWEWRTGKRLRLGPRSIGHFVRLLRRAIPENRLRVYEIRDVIDLAERHDRKIVRITQLQETRRLVAGGGVDSAAEMFRIVGNETERMAFDADERGDHA